MIKGILLGLWMAVFVISVVIILSGISGNLGPNLITGEVIGEGSWTGIGVIGIALSFIIGFFIVLRIRDSNSPA